MAGLDNEDPKELCTSLLWQSMSESCQEFAKTWSDKDTLKHQLIDTTQNACKELLEKRKDTYNASARKSVDSINDLLAHVPDFDITSPESCKDFLASMKENAKQFVAMSDDLNGIISAIKKDEEAFNINMSQEGRCAELCDITEEPRLKV